MSEAITVFFSAAEPSGDSHCADLIAALKEKDPNIKCVGIGGPQMAEQGCQLLQQTTAHAAMLHNAFAKAGIFIKLLRQIKKYLRENKPDAVVLCDSPAFNFHVAKSAKKLNLKTCFYVAPQLWAWGQWRTKKLRENCDKLCCILPFEEEYFKSRDIDTTFVGHPMLDAFANSLEQNARDYSNFEAKNATILLLPGSRDAEINTLWKPIQRIAAKLLLKHPTIHLVAAASDEKRKQTLRARHILGFRCEYIIDDIGAAAKQADFAIAASGSVTLQLAATGCPMLVLYQSNRILWHLLGKYLIKTPYLSLVNIIAGHELVPEFMPYFTSIDPLFTRVHRMLQNPNELTRISSALIQTVTPLATGTASQQTATHILTLCQSPSPQ